MSRQANGTYLQPANTAAVSGNTISSTAFNTLITDIGTEITNSVDRGGRSAMTAPLPMGGQKITGMADPTVATDGATKNYVDTTTAAFFSTGDVKLTLKVTPDAGWVNCNDGTIGSASSGATTLASATTQALFTLIFNSISDTYAPIFTSGGGATTRAAQSSASAAWAANCAISLTKMMGRALAISGSGAGLTGRALGQTFGEEGHILTASEVPTITSSNPGQAITVNPPGGQSVAAIASGFVITSLQVGAAGAGTNWVPITGSNVWGAQNVFAGTNPISVSSNNTGGAQHNTMQPTSFLNAMIKL